MTTGVVPSSVDEVVDSGVDGVWLIVELNSVNVDGVTLPVCSLLDPIVEILILVTVGFNVVCSSDTVEVVLSEV